MDSRFARFSFGRGFSARSRRSRLAVVAVVVAGASFLGGSQSAVADRAPQACRGEVVSFAVQFFGGRRAVADTFFGDYPRAVQDAEQFLQTVICAP